MYGDRYPGFRTDCSDGYPTPRSSRISASYAIDSGLARSHQGLRRIPYCRDSIGTAGLSRETHRVVAGGTACDFAIEPGEGGAGGVGSVAYPELLSAAAVA